MTRTWNARRLGRNIKVLRLLHGLTQKELADRVGVSNVAVYWWEKGKAMPTGDSGIKLARALKVDIEDLYEKTFELRVVTRDARSN